MKVQTPSILRSFFSSLLWEIKTTDKVIFLTFDDGPHPKITPKVLNILAQFQAEASFFCVGDNIANYPEVFQEVYHRGHAVGNHTFNHLNGWKTKDKTYFENIEKCNQLAKAKFFRPPYGKIKSSQIAYLKKQYQIVMWSALAYDFDKNVSEKECLDIAIKHTKPGAILVFHDSEKAKRNMLYALPRFLEHYAALGYRFLPLDG